jgi:hypothetical protein
MRGQRQQQSRVSQLVEPCAHRLTHLVNQVDALVGAALVGAEAARGEFVAAPSARKRGDFLQDHDASDVDQVLACRRGARTPVGMRPRNKAERSGRRWIQWPYPIGDLPAVIHFGAGPRRR